MKKIIFKKFFNLINLHNYQYYNINNPLITNEEYDLLFKKFNSFYNKDFLLYNKSKTKILKNKLLNEKKLFPIRYYYPMLSIHSIFTQNESLSFFKTIKKNCKKQIHFCCELKIDGVAINLIYKNKKLIYAGTRGNGYYGVNITKNIFLIPQIPKNLVFSNLKYILPEYCEIRGEIFFSKKDFNFLKKNDKKFNIQHLITNARNLASGMIQKKDVICTDKYVPQQFLKFYAYNFLFDEKKNKKLSQLLNSQWKILNFLKLMNFKVCKYTILSNSNTKIFNYYNFITEKKEKFLVDIDGIVIKVNNLKLQNFLGRDKKYPKWAIALKFPPNNKITYIRKILWKHMNRYGVITPIAVILPINIAGTTINKINLYNINYIHKLDLHLNDAIMIYKAGEIIPKIHYVIKSLRLINFKKTINIPSHCPYCKSLLRIDKFNNYYCISNIYFCKKQLKDTIKHIISQNALNISIKNSLIDLLIDKNILCYPLDLFMFKNNNLMNFLGEKIITNIKTKIISFKQILYSVGIPSLICKKIALGFNNVFNLYNSTFKIFKKNTGIEGKRAEQIFNYLKQKDIKDLLLNFVNIFQIKKK